jgi:hypothetical protein
VKPVRWIVLAAALAGPGCLTLPTAHQEEPKPLPAPVKEAPPPPAPPAVTPESITEANAREKARALAEEIDRVAGHNDQ